jgi:hypothetical protein
MKRYPSIITSWGLPKRDRKAIKNSRFFILNFPHLLTFAYKQEKGRLRLPLW